MKLSKAFLRGYISLMLGCFPLEERRKRYQQKPKAYIFKDWLNVGKDIDKAIRGK